MNDLWFFRHDGWLGNACDQVHDHLAAIARKGSVEFSKVIFILSCSLKKLIICKVNLTLLQSNCQLFCQPGEDGERITTRNDLKQLLFKYCLPITPDEFEKLWSR